MQNPKLPAPSSKLQAASQPGLFNPRSLLAFSLCSVGALLALVALTHAEVPSASPRIRTSTPTPGTITTFAGDGGSIGQATNTAMVAHGGIVYNGYLYVADPRWNVVRRIDLTTGQQIIIAGNGLVGNGVEQYNGDNIPARQAQLRSPIDVAIDAAGNLYIADTGNHRIRKVAPGGTISTVAGTGIGTALCLSVPTQGGGYNGDNIPATAATLNAPVAVNHDTAGNLYIADFYNERIRKVDTAGTITTYAGTGVGGYNGDGVPATSANIYNPGGMDLDAAGNLFFADVANHRIRKVDTTTQHIITTVAGNGTKAASDDGGLAINTPLVFPWSVAADPASNLYVSDTADFPVSGYILSNRVRKVDLAGVITTLAGNRYQFYGGDGGPGYAGQFNEILGVGVGAGCNVYVTNDLVLDPNLQRVRRVDCADILSTFAGTGVAGYSGDGGPATAAQLTDAVGIVGDAVGNVYIADSTNNRIRKVDRFGTITTYAGTGFSGFAGDGGPSASAMLRLPEGVALDLAGDLYVADSANYRIRKITAAPPHTITTVAGNGSFGSGGDGGPATAAQIGFVHSIAFDAFGDLYIADRNSNKIRKVDISGMISTVAGNGAFCGNTPCPTGDGGPALLAQLNSPEGVALDPAGNLYIADGFNNRIRKIVAGANGTIEGTDTIMTIAGTGDKAYGGDGGPATAAQLNFPQDVALDAAGNLYIGDFANRRVRRVEAVAPPMLSAAVSRKTHGGAGSFDIDLPLAGPPGIECRNGGATGDYTLVFTFVNLLTSVGGASVTSGSGTISSNGIDSSDAHRYIVNLTGVSNAQYITVSLANVSDSAGNRSNVVSASMGVLVGDVNANGVVTNADVSLVKAQVASGGNVDSSNFRNDINANGFITNADVSVTKAQVTATLPSSP